MAIKTTIEQLEEVQAAISAVLKGQDVMVDGVRVTLANLNELTAREQILLNRYKAETGTGGMAINVGIRSR